MILLKQWIETQPCLDPAAFKDENRWLWRDRAPVEFSLQAFAFFFVLLRVFVVRISGSCLRDDIFGFLPVCGENTCY
jgi:hypothetical protein